MSSSGWSFGKCFWSWHASLMWFTSPGVLRIVLDSDYNELTKPSLKMVRGIIQARLSGCWSLFAQKKWWFLGIFLVLYEDSSRLNRRWWMPNDGEKKRCGAPLARWQGWTSTVPFLKWHHYGYVWTLVFIASKWQFWCWKMGCSFHTRFRWLPKSLLGQVEQVDTCRADVVGGGFWAVSGWLLDPVSWVVVFFGDGVSGVSVLVFTLRWFGFCVSKAIFELLLWNANFGVQSPRVLRSLNWTWPEDGDRSVLSCCNYWRSLLDVSQSKMFAVKHLCNEATWSNMKQCEAASISHDFQRRASLANLTRRQWSRHPYREPKPLDVWGEPSRVAQTACSTLLPSESVGLSPQVSLFINVSLRDFHFNWSKNGTMSGIYISTCLSSRFTFQRIPHLGTSLPRHVVFRAALLRNGVVPRSSTRSPTRWWGRCKPHELLTKVTQKMVQI